MNQTTENQTSTVIEYRIKSIYGVDKWYVANDRIAGLITKLTSRKTLLESDLEALEGLGFTFKQVI